ncbi:MAG: UMP kinase [Gammaproteobacteria bacterium]|nr:UMP kinase [Gammaproteobacteria bacterium]
MMSKDHQLVYKRIILKLSGEALQGDHYGLDPVRLLRVSDEIAAVVNLGVQVGIVIGGGNLVRGSELFTTGFDRVTADQMGMLATIINGLALRDALAQRKITARIFSAIPVPGYADMYDRQRVIRTLEKGRVAIFVGGTGNPLVTTDSAAALRGAEISADIILKATKVDGVFAADPVKNPKATRYTSLTYDEVFEQRLGVMDLNAILLCRDHNLLLRVFNMNLPNALRQIVLGEAVGTLVGNGDKI